MDALQDMAANGAAPASMPFAATPSKSGASTKDVSGSASKRAKKAAERSPEPSLTMDTRDAATSGQEPTKRAARASAVSAMANWKQSKMFTDEEDSGSDEDGPNNRRGKKVRTALLFDLLSCGFSAALLPVCASCACSLQFPVCLRFALYDEVAPGRRLGKGSWHQFCFAATAYMFGCCRLDTHGICSAAVLWLHI
jgi:hypothetical protein